MGSYVQRMLSRAAIALLLTSTVAGCSRGHDDWASPPLPTPSTGTLPTPVTGRFTGFTNPCPTGTRTSSSELYISTIVRCSFGDQKKFPAFDSIATIYKPLASQGTPDEAAARLFRDSKDKDEGKVAKGIRVEDRAGLGDEAYLQVSHDSHSSWLVVRSANVLISVLGQVDISGDRDKKVAALEPRLTELAKALLAQLK